MLKFALFRAAKTPKENQTTKRAELRATTAIRKWERILKSRVQGLGTRKETQILYISFYPNLWLSSEPCMNRSICKQTS
jgi:hypothetical protein